MPPVPNAHVLEAWALADPLLAHLPVADPLGWRIGHFTRTIPDGYIETLESGRNQILNPDLAAYYDRLALVVKGDIFAPGRLAEILRLNTGYYNDLIQKYHLTETVVQ
jgi:arabinofuranosyltransferase